MSLKTGIQKLSHTESVQRPMWGNITETGKENTSKEISGNQ